MIILDVLSNIGILKKKLSFGECEHHQQSVKMTGKHLCHTDVDFPD